MCVCVFSHWYKEPHHHMYIHVLYIYISYVYTRHAKTTSLNSQPLPPQPATNHGHRCGGLASASGALRYDLVSGVRLQVEIL